MTDPRILRLRIELYAAAQQLRGEDLAAFTTLIGEVGQALAGLRFVARANLPSIAELQRLGESESTDGCIIALADVAPALLEIAAAALLEHGPCDHPEGRCANGSHFRGCARFEGELRMRAALAKVRA